MPTQTRMLHYVEHLASMAGVRGAALVDAESGMVWMRAGQIPDMEHIAESAVEFWRLHQRMRGNLIQLGELHAISVQCNALTLKLLPTSEQLGERDLITVIVIDWHTN